MNFKLTPDFTEADIKAIADEFVSRVIKVLKNELEYIGLEMMQDARLKTKSEGGFDDQTGNLRSSIFYSVFYDGQVLAEEFKESDIGTDKQTGIEAAEAYSEQIREENPTGWGIVLGAGMNYASFVEAKGYDVVTGATLGVSSKLEKALQNVIAAFD